MTNAFLFKLLSPEIIRNQTDSLIRYYSGTIIKGGVDKFPWRPCR